MTRRSTTGSRAGSRRWSGSSATGTIVCQARACHAPHARTGEHQPGGRRDRPGRWCDRRYNDLADGRIPKLGHGPSKFGKISEAFSTADEKLTESLRPFRRIHRNVADDPTQIAPGGWRQGYLIIHDGNSRSTSSREILSPRSASKSPWRTAATNSISRATACKETSSGMSCTVSLVLMVGACAWQVC